MGLQTLLRNLRHCNFGTTRSSSSTESSSSKSTTPQVTRIYQGYDPLGKCVTIDQYGKIHNGYNLGDEITHCIGPDNRIYEGGIPYAGKCVANISPDGRIYEGYNQYGGQCLGSFGDDGRLYESYLPYTGQGHAVQSSEF